MRRPRSTCHEAALLVLLATLCIASRVRAQACCAAASAVTPGRLELHEAALAGMQLRAATVLGSYETGGRYLGSPRGDTEHDFEEDVFGAVRVFGRGQVALLVPVVETFRATPQDGGHFGGGMGDANLSVRYDFVIAGQRTYLPGIALLAGLTAPTGRAPDAATQSLAVDATGMGAFQLNGALALEQTFGSWLVNATGIVAKRTPRFGETLGTQVTFLAAGAYTFANDAALSLSASYSFEGNAVAERSGGSSGSKTVTDVPASSKRMTVISFSGLWPLNDTWRILGGLFWNPSVNGVGSNQPATGGLTCTVIRSWI